MEDKRILKVAQAVHDHLHKCDGDPDCGLLDDVYRWLVNADNPETVSLAHVADYVREWKEWTGETDTSMQEERDPYAGYSRQTGLHHPDCQCTLCVYDGAWVANPVEY
jgi:hypothetical protein